MRYRVGEEAGVASYGSTDEVLLMTCVLGIIIGVLLTWLGWRGRQWWLVFWCGGLVLVSIATLGWELLV